VPVATPATVPATASPPSVAPAASPLSSLRDTAPATYTPKHLAEKILQNREAFEGERKQVTVMFCDVSGFTAMSERLDPEEVHAIMDRAFEVILNAVHHYEGTVNQFLGDGVMALFGAPIAHEDHPHRAIRASLAIQDGLGPLREEIQRKHAIQFRIRMGINTGLVFVGTIGRDLRMDYTALGDTVNLAARLLGVAGPGQVVISKRTKRPTDGYFTFEDLGEFTLKGKSEPVRAWAVKGEIRGRTRLEVSRERGLTPLAGRERELDRLQAAFDRAARGEGRAALLVGEPGVGKSRLLYELLHRIEPAGPLELEATCVSHGRGTPFHPVLEIVRRALGVMEDTSEAVIRKTVAERLQSLGIEGEELPTLLVHFLGLAVPTEFLARLSGAQLRERTFAVLRDMLLRASREAAVVLVVENLHWIDASSEEFLQSLVAALPEHRVLLLLSARPGYVASWLPQSHTDTILLEGLGVDEVHAMIRRLVTAEQVSPALVEILLARGEGNPLYVEEIVRQLQETGGIVVEAGEARLDVADVHIPSSIHDIIAARIDRLSDPVKHALQVAAVVGRDFSVPLVARVLDDASHLGQWLDELSLLELVFPKTQGSEPVYSFKHALTQEVAYGSLLERRRRVYHATVGRCLEEIYAGRIVDGAELLAYHYGRSAEDEKAVDYAILAAEKAQRRWAHTEALGQFGTALKRLDTMPDAGPNRIRRIDAIVKQSEIMFALGRHAEHVHALEGIRDVVESAGDPPRRAAWHCWTGLLSSLTGARPEVSIRYCREASTIAEANGLEEIRAIADSCLSQVYSLSGELRDALAAGEQALAAFEARGNVWWACRTLWGLSMAANAAGQWDRSLGYCRRALAHGQAVNDLRLKVVGWWRTGSTLVQRGDPEAGLRCYVEALALSPIPFDAAMAKAGQGYGLIKVGQVREGVTQLEEAVAWFERSNLRYTRSTWALRLVEGYLRLGERSKARVMAEEVLPVGREGGYRHLEGVAERLLAEILIPDDPPGAAEHLATATRILETIDARDELGKALLVGAELRRVAGDRDGSRELLERARAIFEELATRDDLVRARSALAALESRPA
jgi:class 3 adenylate cyclase/tetratricopeptide (TPR) repeat protein